MHITVAARRLGITAGYLRLLERTGQIPPARRDLNGRIYTNFDIALLRTWGSAPAPTAQARGRGLGEGTLSEVSPVIHCRPFNSSPEWAQAARIAALRFALECFHRRKGQGADPQPPPMTLKENQRMTLAPKVSLAPNLHQDDRRQSRQLEITKNQVFRRSTHHSRAAVRNERT